MTLAEIITAIRVSMNDQDTETIDSDMMLNALNKSIGYFNSYAEKSAPSSRLLYSSASVTSSEATISTGQPLRIVGVDVNGMSLSASSYSPYYSADTIKVRLRGPFASATTAVIKYVSGIAKLTDLTATSTEYGDLDADLLIQIAVLLLKGQIGEEANVDTQIATILFGNREQANAQSEKPAS